MRFLFCWILSLFFLVSCSQQTHTTSEKNFKTQIYFNIENDGISYSILQNTIPQEDIENYLFRHYISYERINVKRRLKYTSNIMNGYINTQSSFIENGIYCRDSLKEGDSLIIQLLNAEKRVLNSQFIIVQEKPKVQVYLFKNSEKLTWNIPYLFVSQIYQIEPVANYYCELISQNNLIYDTLKYNFNCDSSSCSFALQKTGYLTFYTNSSKQDTVYSSIIVSENFPKKNSPKEMLQSLYLLYEDKMLDSLCGTQIGPKLELDKLWLAMSNNNELQAKQNISEYYSRIEFANKQYTNIHNEGMYSDLGRVYIMFGKPYLTETKNDTLTWYYSNNTYDISKTIQFTHPFTSGAPIMKVIKNSQYEIRMNQAKSNWLQGIIFNLAQI